MKKSTRALGAAVIFFGVAVSLSLAIVCSPKRDVQAMIEINPAETGRMHAISLPGFSSIKSPASPGEGGANYFYVGDNVPVIVVRELDSISMPTVSFAPDWKPYLKYDVDSAGCLVLDFDFSGDDRADSNPGVYVNTPVVVTVPRGMLESVCFVRLPYVELNGLETSRLVWGGIASTKAVGCRIDTLDVRMGTTECMSAGKFLLECEKSRIAHMNILRSVPGLVLRADSLSSIGSMTVSGGYDEFTDLDISEARCGSLKWNPDNGSVLNLRVSAGMKLDFNDL